MGAAKAGVHAADATTPATAATTPVKTTSKEETLGLPPVDGSQSNQSVRGAGDRESSKGISHPQQGAAEALADLPAEDASLSPNLHQKEGELATEGSGSLRQNLYVVEGGRSSKTDLNPETEEYGNGVWRFKKNPIGEQPVRCQP